MAHETTFARAVIVTAALALVFGALHLAAGFVGQVLLALFFAVLCRPVYDGLRRRGVPDGLALVAVALGLLAIVLLLGALIGVSIGQIVGNIRAYQDQLRAQLGGVRAWLADQPLPAAPLGGLLDDSAITGLLLRVLGVVSGLTINIFYLLVTVLFLLADLPRFGERLHGSLGAGHPLLIRLAAFGPATVRYFGLRTYLNAMTGLGVAIALWLLGIDYAPLWGVLIFFLAYVPYVGIFVASTPPVILALAEYGPGRALLVIVGITAINLTLENVVMPRIVGRGLSVPGSVVFITFFGWTALLGGAGALLAMFLTLLLIVILDSFPDTRWLAALLGAAPLPADPAAAERPPAPATLDEGIGA